MNERFLQYIRLKNISQNKLSELSGVSVSTISRFCNGGVISSDKLLRLLQVCDDLSLDWLFYGSGSMIRRGESVNINMGPLAGADVATGDVTVVKNSSGVSMDKTMDRQLFLRIADKDRIITEKDKTISERDATIRELNRIIIQLQSAK